MKNKISLIIPVLSLELESDLLKNALDSVEKQKVKPHEVLIVLPTSEKQFINKIDFDEYSFKHSVIYNSKDTSFGSQVNVGVNKSKGTHVMIMGVDDEISDFYVSLVYKYLEQNPDEIYLPLTINFNEDKFLGLSNEIAWAESFANTQGVIDFDAAKRYPHFSIYGIVVKKDKFIEFGGIKPSIKLTFNQETLLRFSDNGMIINVIPRLCYKRLIGRENSLSKSYSDMSFDEVSFWTLLPEEEYKFITDRNIVYKDISDNA